VKDENGDLLADSQNILNVWKIYFSQLLNVHNVRQIEVHMAEPLVPSLSCLEAEITNLTNLTIYQRGPYYFGIKLFNHLPSSIKELACNAKRFRVALSAFLHTKSFYTLDEYFNQG
jgi:hypothetical protein